MNAKRVLIRLAIEIGIVAAVAVAKWVIDKLDEPQSETIDVEPIIKPSA